MKVSKRITFSSDGNGTVYAIRRTRHPVFPEVAVYDYRVAGDEEWISLEAETLRQARRELGLRNPKPSPPSGPPSDRQEEVWELIRQGLTNAEIAERLGLKHRTVKHHTDALRNKLGVKHKRQLITLNREDA